MIWISESERGGSVFPVVTLGGTGNCKWHRRSIEILGADGRYGEVDHSPTFPFVTPSDLLDFLRHRMTLGESAAVAEFQAWVRHRIAGGTR